VKQKKREKRQGTKEPKTENKKKERRKPVRLTNRERKKEQRRRPPDLCDRRPTISLTGDSARPTACRRRTTASPPCLPFSAQAASHTSVLAGLKLCPLFTTPSLQAISLKVPTKPLLFSTLFTLEWIYLCICELQNWVYVNCSDELGI